MGQRQRRLHVALLVPETPVDLGAGAGVGYERAELGAERANARQRGGERGHGGFRRRRVEGASGRGERAAECAERRAERDTAVGRQSPEAGERRVDAVQDVGLGRRDRGLRVDEPEAALGGPRVGAELARALAAVHGARAHAELLPRHAEQRIVDPGRHADPRVVLGPAEAADAALVELAGLPRGKPLLREARGIGRDTERVARELGGRVVVLAAARALERQRHDHVRAERAHHADHVAERLLPAPLREGLLDAERVAELVGAAEVLLDPVVAVERQQLARAQHAERVE